jgi:hypothetical protein
VPWGGPDAGIVFSVVIALGFVKQMSELGEQTVSDQNGAADIAPLSKAKHGDWSLDSEGGYDFARRFSVVPVVLRETSAAALELPIFFTREGDGIKMIALLSVRKGKNAHVREDGTWEGDYIPAVLRQYPFVIGMVEGQSQALLSIDQGYPGFNQEGRGAALFDDSGEPAKIVASARQFAEEFAKSSTLTRKFCEDLNALDILDPMSVTLQGPDGTKNKIQGLLMVSREKLKALPADEVYKMLRSGMMEVIFSHLLSLGNLGSLAPQSTEGRAARHSGQPRPADMRQLG